ncbi:uncharacterized protein [Gossypium hirsutum]|uniref:Gag-asp_proteas domain-containing protein n=1 Tax=Gossypium hirsutum TaxID=3635 RepID=A0ABM3AM80_GOSHI|nr:uncharacterized protein LOC107906658 [Gossypium hirsutum]
MASEYVLDGEILYKRGKDQAHYLANTANPSLRGKEHCKAITLRSGKQTDEPIVDSTVAPPDIGAISPDGNVDSEELVDVPDKEINIALVDTLVQILSYGKFMKDLLSKMKKLTDVETITLTEGCSVILTNKLPLKLKDPGNITIPCSIGNQYLGKALSDLGASINLMPLSTFQKFGIGHMKPIIMTLQLVHRSLVQPEGKIKDILVPVDKFIFSTNFIMLDCEADKEVPIILG